MIAAGAEREVRAAHIAGASITARKALGFEELLAGDIEGMKRRTRNYARRQLTWMRKLAGVNVIDATGRTSDQVAGEIIHRLNETPA
jgi:tRNA dimethylallyltransferase